MPLEGTLPPAGFFTFLNTVIGTWIDPPIASGYEYEMLSDSNFTAILAFPAGFEDQRENH